MTKNADSVPSEPTESEILNDNSPALEDEGIDEDIDDSLVSEKAVVLDDMDDSSASDKAVISEESLPVKKKTVTRKRTAATVGPKEAKVKKASSRRPRSAKIDHGDSPLNAPVMKAFWGVFNPMMVQVAQYNYADEDEARKVAADMTEKKKAPHFVQLVKKVL